MNLRSCALIAAVTAIVAAGPVASVAATDVAPATATVTEPPTTEPPTTEPPTPPVTANDFLPESENVGTCIGTLERPGCGSKAKGDFRQYLTFLALALGLGFIGWRITIAIRQRDREHTRPTGNTF